MSNFLRRAYRRFEEEVESDKYSTEQRLAAAALGVVVILGGTHALAKSDVARDTIDSVASFLGHDEKIQYYDD